jgi:hypothetical protein
MVVINVDVRGGWIAEFVMEGEHLFHSNAY